AAADTYTLSLHDALPIYSRSTGATRGPSRRGRAARSRRGGGSARGPARAGAPAAWSSRLTPVRGAVSGGAQQPHGVAEQHPDRERELPVGHEPALGREPGQGPGGQVRPPASGVALADARPADDQNSYGGARVDALGLGLVHPLGDLAIGDQGLAGLDLPHDPRR